GLEYNITGAFNNLDINKPYGLFSVEARGVVDEKSQNTTKSLVNFFTQMPLKKDVVGKQADLTFNVIVKSPSIFLNDIALSIEDILQLNGIIQLTERFAFIKSSVFSELRDITLSNINFDNF